MNRRNVWNKKILKTFKDYLFPIVVVGILGIIFLSFLFSWDSKTNTPSDTNDFFTLTLSSPGGESYIEYTWGKRVKIEGETSLYKSEKVQVVSDGVALSGPLGKFNLNRLWELKYNENGGLTLYSSDLWAQASKDMSVEMRYAKLTLYANAVVNMSQNEVASTIYVLSGTAEVQNLVGISTVLQKGDKIVIMRNNANDKNTDISLSKETIDDYIKNDDWFVKNNGTFYLEQSQSEELSGSWESLSQTGSVSQGTSSLWISFDGIYDGGQVTENATDIKGSIADDSIVTIEINGKNAQINTTDHTFSLGGVNTSGKVNDIVYKLYDSQSNLVNKWVLTLYNAQASGTASNTSSSNLAQVENYPISSSPLYQITNPKQNPITTEENVVRIEGTVPARTVKKIIINDFQLQKFIAYSSYWQYFANSDFGNLKPGVNIYNIKFYGESDNLLYETNFTIIKQWWEISSDTGSTAE